MAYHARRRRIPEYNLATSARDVMERRRAYLLEQAKTHAQAPSKPDWNLPTPVRTFLNDWKSFLNDNDMADFTIKCGSESMKVHSFVLAVRSPVFKAILQHDTVDKRNKEVTIDDVEPDALKAMIEYMYGFQLKLRDLEIVKVCQLAAVADKYGLIELKNTCFEHAFRDIKMEDAGDLMILARRHSGPEKFRKKILDFCKENFKEFRKEPSFKEVMEECREDFFPRENNSSGLIAAKLSNISIT